MDSRFGTFFDDARLDPNVDYIIESGSIYRIGAVASRVRFMQKSYLFCMTRLEKQDKERLKRNVKTIKSRIVANAEIATHVVANKCAATIKLLTAVVFGLKLVTGDWLGFAETLRPSEVIPKEEEYLPTILNVIP